MKRIDGLDSIRALCAFWVVMSHFGGPPIEPLIGDTTAIERIITGVYNNLWNGPAAVIVFFVISGFVIHYPYQRELTIASVPAYFVRRYVRICIPMLIAIGVSLAVSRPISLFHDSILWSLVAELIYYSLYPVVLMLRRNGLSLTMMVLVAFAMAFLLAASNPTAGNYPSFGLAGNWLLGLPCWLLGCWLAEWIVRDQKKPSGLVYLRILIFGTATILSILRFHSPLGYPWTLNLFAVLVIIWLFAEIRRFEEKSPPLVLEWMGKWSYSLYLVHGLANFLFVSLEINVTSLQLQWGIQMLLILSISYAFYLVVEYPSHLLARRLAVIVSGRAKNEPARVSTS